MSIRMLLVSSALVVAVCAVASSQPKPPTPYPNVDFPRGTVPSTGTIPDVPPIPPQAAVAQPLPKPATPTPSERGPTRIDLPAPLPAPPPPPAPVQKSVEALLTELESIRTQKAELERKEKELKAAIGKKLEEQAERLKKLGVAPAPAKDAEPDRVGRIIIEGNTRTPDRKILEKLELQPGQVLQYPALEKSRAALEKAGFRDVTVEVIRNELDPTFKDVRVRVTEPKSEPAPASQLNVERILTDGGSRRGNAVPQRVQNIVIDEVITPGVGDKERKAVLDAIGVEPGQVFVYPVVLDEMRKRLEKSGFRSSTVEVLGSDPVSKTLVVKLSDPKK